MYAFVNSKWLMLVAWLALCCMAAAQEMPPVWRNYIDSWQENLYDDSPANEEEFEALYQSLRDSPINLNDTLSDDLRQLPFVGDLRWRILKAYIAQHGPLLSVNELELLNGYDATTVEMLRPVVTVAPMKASDTLRLRTMLTRGRHQLLLGGGTTIEQARGYKEGQYEGDPWRLYMRYQYRYGDRLQLSLSADKDAGEALFKGSQRQGFDFYGGHIFVRHIGIVRQAIVGRYNLQFGQGLTLWSGFAPYGSFTADGCRYARGIATASAFAEYGYMQGAAATLQMPAHTELTVFYSNAARDATLDAAGNITSLYASGYHRTAAEIAKKDNLREQLYGMHLQYDAHHLNLGLTFSYMSLSDSITPRDYVYNHFAFRDNKNVNMGFDARYRYRNTTLYGELATTHTGALAALAGATIAITPDHSIGVAARHYAPDYYNLHHAPPMRTSGGRNEQGICITYHTMLPWQVKALAEIDAYRLPAMQSCTYAPSQGALCRIRLNRMITRQIGISVGYSWRSRDKNSSTDEAAEYIVEQTIRRQLTADLDCESGPWRLRTRLAACWHNSELTAMRRGFIIYQDVQYTAPRWPLSATLRYLLFDVEGYDARLYASESDLAYQMTSSMYNGKGSRFYAVLRYSFSQRLTLAAKYAVTTYPDAETIGSSYEQIDGDCRQSVKMQLRWNF